MLKINQKGFAGIEAVLIVLIVLIVGGTGYYIYSANKKTSATLDGVAKVAQSSPPKTKKKVAAKPAASAPVVDDRTAILAAIKAQTEAQPATDQNGQPITFSYTIDQISGVNAKGSRRPSSGDPGVYIAQKQSGSWKIIYTGHMPPFGPTFCTQNNLPSDWCMPIPS